MNNIPHSVCGVIPSHMLRRVAEAHDHDGRRDPQGLHAPRERRREALAGTAGGVGWQCLRQANGLPVPLPRHSQTR